MTNGSLLVVANSSLKLQAWYRKPGPIITGESLIITGLETGSGHDDLPHMVTDLNAKGITVQLLKENLTFTGDDSLSKLLFDMLGSFAESERSLIRERQREGIALAKKAGVYRGRKPSLTAEQADDLRKRVASGEKKAVLARQFGISRETLFAYLASA